MAKANFRRKKVTALEKTSILYIFVAMIVECVPNFSEGRDGAVVEQIVDRFRGRAGVKLLDYSADPDHNRMVVTAVGKPAAMKQAVVEAIGVAISNIDLSEHGGVHPRMGAADVVPFIPIRDMTMEQAVELSREVAQEVASRYNLPVFLYEKSASAPHRANLSVVRQGGFEGLAAKMARPEWHPDFGPAQPHPTAGATVIGARMPLVAYNVNLRTTDLKIADAIARRVRHIGGGLAACKAMGVALESQGMVQVSMNLTDYTRTAIYQAHEMVRMEAARWGVAVAGGELIGLVPLQALVDVAAYYLGIEGLTIDRVLNAAVSD